MNPTLHKLTTAGVAVTVLSLAFTFSTAKAEEVTGNASVNTQIDASVTTPPLKNPLEKRPPLRAEIQGRIQQNKEIRNDLLEKKQIVKKEMKAEVKEMRADMKDERAEKMMMFKKDAKDMRQDIAKKMEVKMFETRKAALVKELNLSLTNIASISTRIDARIVKAESEGRTLTEAKALLVTAKDKLAKAKVAVAAFEALPAPTTATSTVSGTASSTANIELAKPRQIGDAAIKAVKEARDAFQKVVVSIAHSMGVKADATATSTNP